MYFIYCFAGNEALHAMTEGRKHELRVNITDWSGSTAWAEWKDFRYNKINVFFSPMKLFSYLINIPSGNSGHPVRLRNQLLFLFFKSMVRLMLYSRIRE